MHLVLNRPKCLRSGQCTYLHPKLFKEGPDGYPVVLVEEPEGELAAEADDAANICPSGAIDLLEVEAR
jgi:ferredoxin